MARLKRTRADLVHTLQAVADSGRSYRLTVTAEEAKELARALRALWSSEAVAR